MVSIEKDKLSNPIYLIFIFSQGRSAAPIVSGGSQRQFETQVGLFRRTPGTGGDFTLAISPGAALPLGEDLMLRANVREGDGK